jgi:hypothetical protein
VRLHGDALNALFMQLDRQRVEVDRLEAERAMRRSK